MKKIIHQIIILLCLAASIIITADLRAASDEESILSFQSDITVEKSSALRVTETITVRCLGNEIKHGIYRDFPTIYHDKLGFSRIVEFNVIEVLRDGQPESYHIDDQGNGKRVYIGRQNVFLDPGIYAYTITYTTGRQFAFVDDHAELYWNVTGNGWSFAIERAEARVYLPGEARKSVLSRAAWTGPSGSTEQNFISSVDGDGVIHFTSTKPLNAGEGLTISVKWPRGIVSEPSKETLRREFLKDNIGSMAGLAGTLLVLIYYFIAWIIAGRDPRKGTIIPLYEPPDNLSPAALRFITEMGYDHHVFAAAVISMAVKGYLTVKEHDGEYTLKRTETDESGLSPEEKKIAAKLFKGKDSIKLETDNHSKIAGAIKSLKTSLSLTYEKQYFVKNLVYFVPGLLLSLAVLIVSFILIIRESPEIFILIWLAFWTAGVVFLVSRVVLAWRQVHGSTGSRVLGSASALFLTVFSIPFVAAELFVLGYYLTIGPVWILVILLGVMALNYLFYRLLKAPTRAGRKLLDKIEGFRLYLTVAERDRLEMVQAPVKDVATFERFLPYALALGVENSWAEYFAGVLNVRGDSAGSYSPHWYSGPSWNRLGASGFASSFESSLAGAISSSSTAPGSGSGGGGSSGGGGGGGGGGGW